MRQTKKDIFYRSLSVVMILFGCYVALILYTLLDKDTNVDQTHTQEELRVGLLLPFTGQYGWVGSNVTPVAQMVTDDVNNAGGIGNHRIVLYQGDTEGVVDVGLLAAQKLINVDGVVAVIGPTSLSFIGTRQVFLDTQTPMISPTAGTTELDRGCDGLCFRTVPSDRLGGQAIARAAIDGTKLDRIAGFTKVVLLIGRSPAMISFETPIRTAFERYDTPLELVLPYNPGKPSYRSEVSQAMHHIPELIILVGTPEDSARIMLNAYQAGYAGEWFVTQDQTTDDYLTLIDTEVAEGMYGLVEVESPESSERNLAFEVEYRLRTNEDVKIFGPNTYDAMTVLALAMLHAHLTQGTIDRTQLVTSIREVANLHDGDVSVSSYLEGKEVLESGQGIDYRGLIGPLDFDAYGNIRAPFGIRQVSNGQWQDISIITAADLQ